MSEHITQFLRATEGNDVPAMMQSLAPGAQLVSPLVHAAVFSRRDDLEILLSAVYRTLQDLQWTESHRDDSTYVVLGRCRVLGREMHDAMILRTDETGRITSIEPHLRPWSGLTAFALALGPKLARHPQVLRRAAKGG